MADYFYSLTELLKIAGYADDPTIAGAMRWGALSGDVACEENQ